MFGAALDVVMLGAFALGVARTAGFVALAIVDRARRGELGGSVGGVTVAVPCRNEEAVIAATMRSVPADVELIVIDDGSTDRTREIADGVARELDPDGNRIRVLSHTPSRGKSRALDRALEAASGEVFVTLDADTLAAPDCVARLAARMADPRVGAVAANIKVGNRTSALLRWQSIEYIGGLNVDRRAQHALGAITTVPGAAGAWRTSAVRALGGFPHDTLTEDTDLTLQMLRAGWSVAYEDRAVAFTEAPATVGALFRQRTRWLRGNLQCAAKHNRAAIESVRGAIGISNLWWSHLGIYLVPMVSGIWLWTRAGSWFSLPQLLIGMAGLLAVDLGVVLLSYTLDGESPADLPHAPVQRLLYPFVLWSVFVAVMWRIATGVAPEWARVARTGALAKG